MSVRESAAQQSEGEMRLHEMVVKETPRKPELLFDPETEITQEELERMMNVAKVRTGADDHNVAEVVTMLRIVFPEKINEFDANANVEIENLKERMMNSWSQGETEGVRKGLTKIRNFVRAMTLKMVFPEANLDICRPFLDREVQSSINRGEEGSVLDDGFTGMILFPEDFSLKGKIDKNLEQKIKKWVGELKSSEFSASSVLQFLAQAKTVFPGMVEKIYTKEEQQGMISRALSKLRGAPPDFSFSSSLAKGILWASILAAKEVRITKEKGLELIMPESENFREPKTPLPERRKF